MGEKLDMLVGLIGPYITRALGIGLAGAVVFAGVQTMRLDSAKAKLEACQAKREQLLTDIELLQDANKAYRKEAEKTAKAALDARTEALRQIGRASALAEQLRSRPLSGRCDSSHLKGIGL